MQLRLNCSRITFARKIFFQVSSLLRFRKMRGQNAMDTLNVRTARWVTKVPWHGGNSGQHAVVHRQTDLFPGPPRVLFVKTVERPLFPSTIKITTRLFNLNFPYRITYMDNLLSFFPEIWKFLEFSVPLVIPFRRMPRARLFESR